jgi:hypothetical protein
MESGNASRVSLQDTVRVSEDVVFRELDGEAVLLHLGSGIYFGLNEVGTRIWNLLQQHGSLQRVFEQLLSHYEVSPQQLQDDLLALVGQMRDKGLLEERLPTPV